MRDYGSIHTRFWINPKVQQLSTHAKLLALYLLTSPHTNMLGCFRLPLGYIIEDLKLSRKAVVKGFEELFHMGFLTLDKTSDWLIINNFLQWNPIENPNQAKSIIKLFEQVPSELNIYPHLVEVLLKHADQFEKAFQNRLQTLSKQFQNPLERVSQPFLNQKQDQKQKQEQDQEHTACQSEFKQNDNDDDAGESHQVVVIKIPLIGSTEFVVTPTMIEQWQTLYPAVDIIQELRNLCGWNLANPQRRKTKTGILKHINTWLAKKQNAGGNYATSYTTRSPPLTSGNTLYGFNMAIGEQWLEQDTKMIAGELAHDSSSQS